MEMKADRQVARWEYDSLFIFNDYNSRAQVNIKQDDHKLFRTDRKKIRKKLIIILFSANSRSCSIVTVCAACYVIAVQRKKLSWVFGSVGKPSGPEIDAPESFPFSCDSVACHG